MKDEYIIINKTTLEEKIKELKKAFDAGLSYLDTNIPIAEKKDYIKNLKLDI